MAGKVKGSEQLYLYNVMVDCVIFGFGSSQLKFLLLKLKNNAGYSLPGRLIRYHDTVEKAAEIELQERTGLKNIYLRQFNVFSKVDRFNNNPITQIVKEEFPDASEEDLDYFRDRFISIGFYALVDYTKVDPKPDRISDSCIWVNIDDSIPLILDHREIIKTAHATLKNQINTRPIGMNLLPKKFTMPELQILYELILEKKLDRRNFQRRILSYNILDKLDEKRRGGAHKSPYLYKFNTKRYYQALEHGLINNWR